MPCVFIHIIRVRVIRGAAGHDFAEGVIVVQPGGGRGPAYGVAVFVYGYSYVAQACPPPGAMVFEVVAAVAFGAVQVGGQPQGEACIGVADVLLAPLQVALLAIAEQVVVGI